MSKSNLKLRVANDQDSRLFWRWRNERSTLKNSFSGKPVPWTVHRKWFQRKLFSAKSHLFVLESNGKPVGQIRMELNGRGTGEVHIGLDKKARGKGHAKAGLLAVTRKFLGNRSIKKIVAHIKPENLASVAVFLSAGFCFARCVKIKGVNCYQLTKGRR